MTSKQRARTQALVDFDRGLGNHLVAGADEAGRGCLAGPLFAAGVLIDYDKLSRGERRRLTGLDDSKKMDLEQRERLYEEILRIAVRVCVSVRSADGIDRRGLHRCNIEALAAALEGLRPDGAACLVDGFELPSCRYGHSKVIGGDARSAAIAAASVVAKVSRDRHMKRMAERHPGWGFEEHVGYSTPMHRQAIERLGPSPIHRLSFASAAYDAHRLRDGSDQASERCLDVLVVD